MPPLSSVFPVVDGWAAQVAVLAVALLVTVVGSELLLRWFVRTCVTLPPPSAEPAAGPSPTDEKGAGRVIGKCENLLVFVFVQLGSFDGLGLVLAAKSIARMEAIKKNASYYLGGTLVNFTWSLVIALLARLLVFGPPGA